MLEKAEAKQKIKTRKKLHKTPVLGLLDSDYVEEVAER